MNCIKSIRPGVNKWKSLKSWIWTLKTQLLEVMITIFDLYYFIVNEAGLNQMVYSYFQSDNGFVKPPKFDSDNPDAYF